MSKPVYVNPIVSYSVDLSQTDDDRVSATAKLGIDGPVKLRELTIKLRPADDFETIDQIIALYVVSFGAMIIGTLRNPGMRVASIKLHRSDINQRHGVVAVTLPRTGFVTSIDVPVDGVGGVVDARTAAQEQLNRAAEDLQHYALQAAAQGKRRCAPRRQGDPEWLEWARSNTPFLT